MTAQELAGTRAQLAEFHKYLGMYTVSATFEEAVALVIGYEAGAGADFLDGFREWLVRRQPDRDYSNFAFAGLIVVEVTQDPHLSLMKDPEVNAKSVAHLFGCLDEYLSEQEMTRCAMP